MIKCCSCNEQLSEKMRAALTNNKCPFCGQEVLAEKYLLIKNEMADIIASNDIENATSIILAQYVIPTYSVSEDIVVSSDDINMGTHKTPTSKRIKQKAIEDVQDAATNDMSDEERAEAEEAWRLMEEGNADAFFETEGAGSEPARTIPRPPPPPRPTGDVRSIQSAVQKAHANMGGDIPEGFEDPSLMAQKGSNRINRL